MRRGETRQALRTELQVYMPEPGVLGTRIVTIPPELSRWRPFKGANAISNGKPCVILDFGLHNDEAKVRDGLQSYWEEPQYWVPRATLKPDLSLPKTERNGWSDC